jgi:chromosomal replication initiation ATPase DnaA
MNQLAFSWLLPTARGRADFLVSACNEAALGWIERWPDWPTAALVLHGPAGSGKTHLAHLWCARAGGVLLRGADLPGWAPDQLAHRPAVAIDQADCAPEADLLHLYNCCVEDSVSLLVVAPEAPAVWPIALPDLASRLRAAATVAISPPDDALLAAILVKHFADRQVHVYPAVIAFLVPRMERTFAAAAALAAQLDALALSVKRPISLGLARQVLAEADAQS